MFSKKQDNRFKETNLSYQINNHISTIKDENSDTARDPRFGRDRR